MRGTVARELRQMVRAIIPDRTIVQYEHKMVIDQKTQSKVESRTVILTEDCQRAYYKGVKKNYRMYV